MNRHLAAGLAAAVALLWGALVAFAGGWAVTTLDQLPAPLRAGETYRIGYTILQHGITPWTSGQTEIRASSSGGQRLTFAAKAEGAPGHYVADVRFPEAGTWSWEVQPGPFAVQKLEPIRVSAAATGSAPAALPAPNHAAPRPGGVGPLGRIALVIATLCSGALFVYQLIGALAARRRAPLPSAASPTVPAVR